MFSKGFGSGSYRFESHGGVKVRILKQIQPTITGFSFDSLHQTQGKVRLLCLGDCAGQGCAPGRRKEKRRVLLRRGEGLRWVGEVGVALFWRRRTQAGLRWGEGRQGLVFSRGEERQGEKAEEPRLCFGVREKEGLLRLSPGEGCGWGSVLAALKVAQAVVLEGVEERREEKRVAGGLRCCHTREEKAKGAAFYCGGEKRIGGGCRWCLWERAVPLFIGGTRVFSLGIKGCDLFTWGGFETHGWILFVFGEGVIVVRGWMREMGWFVTDPYHKLNPLSSFVKLEIDLDFGFEIGLSWVCFRVLILWLWFLRITNRMIKIDI